MTTINLRVSSGATTQKPIFIQMSGKSHGTIFEKTIDSAGKVTSHNSFVGFYLMKK
jgi:hypothetical protein